ncbi:MAG TPA: HipA domain-containing protein, partial [Cyclobacteriaceae bacterium]|nr:HipA domain-containing protein [Cyclobacteriaceae bacterium]
MEGLNLLAKGLDELNDFPYDKTEQLREAVARAAKMSIQGVQPKLSAKFNKAAKTFELTDRGGQYILKPQNEYYPELPENEDLTMRLAAYIEIEVPFHGMIYAKDGSRTYFIKRFDRLPRGKKVALEDFAQLSGQTRETKYSLSMEKVLGVIETYCTFPLIEKQKLFKLTLFSFLCGNEDMHLKNFSLIRNEDKIELSPAYDLLNSSIALANPVEEFALTLNGKKSIFKRSDFVEYYAADRLGLTAITISKTLDEIYAKKQDWENLISIS